MSFLEWRKFNFFDQKKNVDGGSINRALGDTNVTATSCGHGTIVICDSEGVIHLVYRNFNVTTFQGYLLNVSLAEQLKSLPILVTVGEDETGNNPVIKVWDWEKQDRQGNPVCLKTLKTSPNNNSVPASALCVSDSTNMMAVGFVNGAVVLYRGNITKDRFLKQELLRDESDPITGLAFKTTSKYSHIFVATTESILQYNVTVKDKKREVILDNIGCAINCSVLADSIHDSPFMVARKDAVYCYTVDGRGPCYAIDGPKMCLQWFRTYLVIVAEDKSTLQSPVTVSSTNSDESSYMDKGRHVITVLDIQNKFIVFSGVYQEILAVLPEWGSFYVLTKDRNLHSFIEKDLQSKLDRLFKKNLYDISIKIAKNHQYDSDALIDIFRLYGDHLYQKGDHNGAIEQYIKTIGKLEPSYVIRKFLDPQHVDNLITYLSALHKQGVASGDHTTLLLNCYTKLNNFQKLKEFIFMRDRDIDFDLNLVMDICRKSSSEDALLLAEKYNLHLWYVKILLEDHKKHLPALQYIAKLDFTEACDLVMKFGNTFVQHIPNEFTLFLKKLCTNYYPSDTLLLDQVNQQIAFQADPLDFIHLFLKNSAKMVEFLEYLIEFSDKWDTSIYNTLIEHYLHLWSTSSSDVNLRLQCKQKIMGILQSVDVKYDRNQALILCSTRDFKPGILYLLEENKLYHQIMGYHLSNRNYQDVLACCWKFGHQEPSLWVRSLWSAATDSDFPSNILCEILAVIEKEDLLSPLQVTDIVCRSKSLTVEDVRSYYLSVLKTETKIIEEEKALIVNYQQETERIRKHVKNIENTPVQFQASFCSICKNQLELPTVHFLCQHSFHEDCYRSYSENDNECPAPECLKENRKILDIIKSQEQTCDLHETFHSQLERARDSVLLIADYFGRNVFSKIMIHPKIEKQLKLPAQINQKQFNEKIRNYDDIQSDDTLDERENKLEVSSSLILESNISPSQESLTPNMVEESLTNAIENKSYINNVSLNPFDDYDDSKNPFFGDSSSKEEDDDYDKRLNPFA